MEDIVMSVFGLVSSTMHWGLDNALALAVGAVVGGPVIKTATGLVGDVLGRAKEVVDSVGAAASGK